MTERFGVDCLYDRAEKPVAVLLLAHGAGAAMDSDFMNTMAAALASHSVAVLRFEFPYMQRRRDEQRQFPPDRAPKLLAAFAERVREARSLAAELSEIPDGALPLWIGGKSMGGRMASMLAVEGNGVAALDVAGVIALGYPFHPPGKPEKTRIDHLPALTAPMLVCQGERDPFGKPDEVAGYGLPERVQLHWLPSGDHDFKPLKRSGLQQQDLIDESARMAAAFMANGMPAINSQKV